MVQDGVGYEIGCEKVQSKAVPVPNLPCMTEKNYDNTSVRSAAGLGPTDSRKLT